jgi:hypothetical protein
MLDTTFGVIGLIVIGWLLYEFLSKMLDTTFGVIGLIVIGWLLYEFLV